MAARSIATGTISFGLVSIPVRVFSATNPSGTISFHLLHRACGGRVKQQYICPQENDQVVDRSEMIKGFAYAKDRYATFEPDELKALEEKSTQQIEIAEFIPAEKVDPVYFDKPYYLGAEKGGEKAYQLLAEAMRQSGRVALAKYAARGKGYLVMLRPAEEGLVMQQLLYADEVRPIGEVLEDEGKGATKLKESELKLARQLVDQISSDSFHPENYHDEVKERIESLVQKKVEGEEVSFAPPEAPKSKVIDLMDALKASLAKQEKGKESAEAAADERKPAKRAKRSHTAHKAKAR